MPTKKHSAAAGFLLLLLLLIFMFNQIDAQLDAWNFYDCMDLLDEYQSWVKRNPDFGFVMDHPHTQSCRDYLDSVQKSYIATGQLPPEYVEALQKRYHKNQTLVDIHVCGLDLKRCSDETKALWRLRYFGHQYPQEAMTASAPSRNSFPQEAMTAPAPSRNSFPREATEAPTTSHNSISPKSKGISRTLR